MTPGRRRTRRLNGLLSDNGALRQLPRPASCGAPPGPDASNAAGQRAAVGEALRQAFRESGTRLLEPIMKVEITCPEANVGDVLGDLNARRGQIEDVGFRGQQRVITAKVPLRRMFGWAASRSLK